MKKRNYAIAILFVTLLAAVNAAAQTAGVSLKPLLKPGQEARYSLSAAVDTQVTPSGANGIGGSERRELSATLLLRAGIPIAPAVNKTTSKKPETVVSGSEVPYTTQTFAMGAGAAAGDAVYYEAVIEAFEVRSTVDGVEGLSSGKGVVGQKLAFTLDSTGRLVNCAFPFEVVKAGLPDFLFSLLGWAPKAPLEVGKTWEPRNPTGLPYIVAPALSSVPVAANAAYTLSSLSGGKAIVDGVIVLGQPGATMLPVAAVKTKVNLVALGAGTARIEYDVAAGRLASAVTESSLKGRVVHVPPTREGEKMQPREGALVETAKFSVKLLP